LRIRRAKPVADVMKQGGSPIMTALHDHSPSGYDRPIIADAQWFNSPATGFTQPDRLTNFMISHRMRRAYRCHERKPARHYY
jgi:hypothetical protein